jgi:hypothetical protein
VIDECPYPMPDENTVTRLPGVLYFAWEREAIRLARENGHPAPWTADPMLRRYKFTNIRRRDDRVSRWIIENVIAPHEHKPQLWFALLMTRLVNWPPTLRRLLDEGVLLAPLSGFDPRRFSDCVERQRATGAKTYSGAYMIYPTKMDPGGVKSLAIARHIIAPARELNEQLLTVLASEQPRVGDFVTVLASSFGISTFIAGQVAADLTYCAQLDDAVDLYSYAPVGPGSSRGLNYLHDRSPFAEWRQDDFNRALVELNQSIKSELGITDLTLHDVQNIMCEYSKYCRAVLGESTPKSNYQPETEF